MRVVNGHTGRVGDFYTLQHIDRERSGFILQPPEQTPEQWNAVQYAGLKGMRFLAYLVVKPALPLPEGPLCGGGKSASVAEQVIYPLLGPRGQLVAPVK